MISLSGLKRWVRQKSGAPNKRRRLRRTNHMPLYWPLGGGTKLTKFPGRKQRRHYTRVPRLLLYREIGLLKPVTTKPWYSAYHSVEARVIANHPGQPASSCSGPSRNLIEPSHRSGFELTLSGPTLLQCSSSIIPHGPDRE